MMTTMMQIRLVFKKSSKWENNDGKNDAIKISFLKIFFFPKRKILMVK